MSDRVEIKEEALETIVGGNITFDWDGTIGHCGLNGDKSYTFNSRSSFVAAVTACYQAGMTDVQTIQQLLTNGDIY